MPNVRCKFAVGALLGAVMSWGMTASAAEITVKHVQGELTLPGVPQRVLVQDIGVLDNLDALGVKVAGVPNVGQHFPDYLSKYASSDYIRTGTLQEPDYETIAASGADLMIVASRSRTKLPELSKIVPTIDLTADNSNLRKSVENNITTLGNIFDKKERAAELNASLDAKFAKLRSVVASKNQTAIVLVTNAGKLGVYGQKSRLSWIFSEAGFKPVIENIDDRFHGGDAVSFEFILEMNPDWLFVVDRDAGIGQGGAAHQLLDNELVAQTTAWKKGQVVYLDPVDAYIVMHGYTAVTQLVDAVTAAVSAKN